MGEGEGEGEGMISLEIGFVERGEGGKGEGEGVLMVPLWPIHRVVFFPFI